MAITKHLSLDLISKLEKTNIPSPDRFFSIGPYISLALISTGEFSNVYLGLDGKKERIVIKELKTKRSEIELQVLSILEHPNIIKLIDAQSLNDKYYLILEYINGSDLLQYINSQKTELSLSVVKDLMFQMISGLEFAHSRNIIHGDLKPENIMLAKQTIIIIDWGLARILVDKVGIEVGIVGSCSYCAPEQFSKPAILSAASDVWSLGVIFYCLLTRHHPFYQQNKSDDVIERIVNMDADYKQIKYAYYHIFESIFIQREKRLSLSNLQQLLKEL